MSHVRAVDLLSSDEVKWKNIVVIGPNLEVGHGVLKSDINARLTTLSSDAIFTWLWQYEHDDDVRRYVEIFHRCCPRLSIVHSLICAALDGHRGYYLPECLRGRITKSVVELSEETCISTGYYFDDIMRHNVYFKRLVPEMNLHQVYDTIYDTITHGLSSVQSAPSQKSLSLARNLPLPHFIQGFFSFENKSRSTRNEKYEQNTDEKDQE
jgi:hypothetical protein